MIKRLTATWKSLQEKMRADKTDDFLHNVSYAGRPHFPEEVGRLINILIGRFTPPPPLQEDLNGNIDYLWLYALQRQGASPLVWG